jgi:PPK2 family polyphosphate:nucleotide phosphotransferase
MNYTKEYLFKSNQKLSDFDPTFSEDYESKKDTQEEFQEQIVRLRELQGKLYANASHGILIILQGLDAGGKDGVIKHVMSGVNPQGCKVKSFKSPSSEELAHDFMWRCMNSLPKRGYIGIFNRSYYEEVLIARVHPRILASQNLPFYHDKLHLDKEFWLTRCKDMVNFEKYFTNNGFMILKFFLNVSADEQKKRFLSRIDKPAKNWKFTMSDIEDRKFWDDFQMAYNEMLVNTTHKVAPWYVIPADKKWYMRLVISKILVKKMESLNLTYPQVSDEHLKNIAKARVILENEDKVK